MSRRFETKLDDGRIVNVEYRMCGAEPDVGIMSDYAEIESVELEDGTQATLTDAEEQRIFEEACEYGSEIGYPEDY